MREVITRRVWLGNSGDARRVRELYRLGIAAVVDLAAEERPLSLTRDMVYCRFPLVDGGDNSEHILDLAIETTTSLIRKEIPTLVFCGAGMSRSPAIVAAAFAVASGESPESCLRGLVGDQPHDVSPRLWADVQAAIGRRTG